jgi:curved DNA-binding protein CbpA
MPSGKRVFSMLTQGKLSQQSLAETFKSIGVNAPPGVLVLRLPEAVKQIHCENGKVIFASSTAPEDDFGEFLIRIGRLAPPQLEEALKNQPENQPLSRTLLEMNVLEAPQLLEYSELHTAEWIYPLFDCLHGTFEYQTSGIPSVDPSLKMGLLIPNLILEGIRRLTNVEIIHKGLRSEEQTVALAPQFETILNTLVLNSDEAFVLSRVESNITISDILRLSPLDLEMTWRTLYGLLLTGVLQFVASPESSRPQQRTEARKEEIRREVKKATPPPSPPPPPSGLPPKESKAKEKKNREDEVDLDFIRGDVHRKQDDLKTKNYYELLNIPQSSTQEEIKKAYYSLAKKYHPDHYHQPELANLKSALDLIFAELSKAYDVLKVPATRANYDSKIQQVKENSPAPAASAVPSSSSGSASNAMGQQKLADLNFKQGRGYFDQQDYWSAIQAFRQCVRLIPESPQFRHWLAISLTKNPKWRKEAEEHFLKAIELEQFNPNHYIGLALMYKEAGLPLRAEVYLKKALQVAPGNKAAQEALRLLGLKTKKEAKGLKSLKELFRWKKGSAP